MSDKFFQDFSVDHNKDRFQILSHILQGLYQIVHIHTIVQGPLPDCTYSYNCTGAFASCTYLYNRTGAFTRLYIFIQLYRGHNNIIKLCKKIQSK